MDYTANYESEVLDIFGEALSKYSHYFAILMVTIKAVLMILHISDLDLNSKFIAVSLALWPCSLVSTDRRGRNNRFKKMA